MSKKRKKYTPEEKVTVLRKHLLEKISVSDLCDQHGLHPTMFHRWMREFFENGALAFQKQKEIWNHNSGCIILKIRFKRTCIH